jgi:hypothetical protein
VAVSNLGIRITAARSLGEGDLDVSFLRRFCIRGNQEVQRISLAYASQRILER